MELRIFWLFMTSPFFIRRSKRATGKLGRELEFANGSFFFYKKCFGGDFVLKLIFLFNLKYFVTIFTSLLMLLYN